jgi:cysteinyl-tRNA synthetase
MVQKEKMDIKLYNTLSEKIEIFKPLKKGFVSMYNCGPTVYDRVHIGNLRAYIFADTLRRMFEYNECKVKQIINITDIGHLVSDADEGEDKMTKALKREGKPLTIEAMEEIGTKYFNTFIEDLKLINIEPASEFPRASKHISEDIELIQQLEKHGFIYTTSDGLYFDTSKFKGYGKLGKINIDSSNDKPRIASNPEKKNPADFTIWKFDENIGWQSPWGKGFPGWHIECSAMSKKYLGQPFDIHTGGIDHIPVHHNNEIAQSEAAYGVPLTNYWMHFAFLNVNGGKMAKSEGNFITLDTLLENMVSPLAYRYWLLTAHYRTPIEFTYNAVKAAQNALIRLISTISGYPVGGSIISAYKESFLTYINDDLDLPKAIALTWNLLRDDKYSEADKRATILDFDQVFGLNLNAVKNIIEEEIPIEIKTMAEAREEARNNKDWKKADALRQEIENRGFTVRDTDNGFEIKPL